MIFRPLFAITLTQAKLAAILVARIEQREHTGAHVTVYYGLLRNYHYQTLELKIRVGRARAT